ncbi:hypothetical protein LO763_21695 [Glycomyces sp. A-F 0318]|nr:hypothetical protein [Glycomyces amatae]MCD0446229.1 hypothetical protein [Glycomyces amatae]
MSLEQLLLLCLGILEALLSLALHLGSFTAIALQLCHHGSTNFLCPRRGHVQAGIERFDTNLDLLRSHVLACAAIALVAPTAAHEVAVLISGTPPVLREDHERSAATAEQRPLQEVLVLALLLPRQIVSAQDVLNTQPRLHAHQWLVPALMEYALVRHHADVVRIAKYMVSSADGQLLAGALAGGASPQAFLV